MGNGKNDRGTKDRAVRELPIQPGRCVFNVLSEQPTYEIFLKNVKKWIRSCVQEGRENELMDNNDSLIKVYEEIQKMPVSMDLERGRSIEVVPHYQWESTDGYPFWRTTKITFTFHKKMADPPAPVYETYYYCNGTKVKSIKSEKGIYPIFPDDSISPLFKDYSSAEEICKKPPPPPPPPPKKEEEKYDTYYYCSGSGVKELKVKKGLSPQVPSDAKSKLFTNEFDAMKDCMKVPPPIKIPQPKTIIVDSKDGKSSKSFGLGKLMGLFLVFGGIVYFREITYLVESIAEAKELYQFIAELYPKQEIRFHLAKYPFGNKLLPVLIERNGTVQGLEEFINYLRNSNIINEKQYYRALSLTNDLYVRLATINNKLNVKIVRGMTKDWVRGYFIEDAYIEKVLWKQGYSPLPNWFKGFDAYVRTNSYTWEEINGKTIFTFDKPDLVSIKSYQPKGAKGLIDINMDTMKKNFAKWDKDMDFKEFARENIKITNPKMKEIHLILVGEEEKSQFAGKLTEITKMGKARNINVTFFQYKESTGRFIQL